MLNWNDLFAAFALYLVLEGLLPFANPAAWRRTLTALAQFGDGQLRFFGLASILIGLVLLVFVRAA